VLPPPITLGNRVWHSSELCGIYVLDPTGGVVRTDPTAPGNGLTLRDDEAARYRVT
jgi:hypothetical protein